MSGFATRWREPDAAIILKRMPVAAGGFGDPDRTRTTIMRRTIPLALALTLAAAGVARAQESDLPRPESEDRKILYALGFAMSRNLASFGLDEDEVQLVLDGLRDGILSGKSDVPLEEYAAKIEPFLQSRQAAVGTQEKRLGDRFRDELAAEPGAVRTESGMLYFEQQAGTGAQPGAADRVRVHYEGTFRDGRVFDSSRMAGTPVTFSLDSVVPCFSEGIRRMKVGGRARLVCPPELAYGEDGFPPMIPPGATLVFEVELLDVVPPPEEPAESE
jgi:FKBP-type peptidyl-prolyl cis-trans isomerase